MLNVNTVQSQVLLLSEWTSTQQALDAEEQERWDEAEFGPAPDPDDVEDCSKKVLLHPDDLPF